MNMIYKASAALAFAALVATSGTVLAQDVEGALGEALMTQDGTAPDAGIAAATGWHICTVKRTGAGWGNHYDALTCPSGPFTNKWHIMNGAQKDPMLATALSAATSAKKVQVYIQGKPSGYNEIRALYLRN